MKKNLFFAFLISAVVVCSGCSKQKVLDCTRTEDETGATLKENEKVTFKGTSVVDYEASIDVVIDEKYKSYKSTFVSYIEKEYKEYEEIKGVTLKTKETDDGVKISLKADVQKMADKDLKTLDLEKKADYNKTKDARKKAGFTCK